jgi:catechol 2,3-dioxygenase-like lactoylglutathione lyase family enzyme
MLDHISIPVRNFARAAAFYDAVLATIGLKRTRDREGQIGYGTEVPLPPVFWIHAHSGDNAARSGIGLHISFRVKSREEVHAFHAAALAHGGKDAGAPGQRPQYTAGFYGAFALDPEGFKIEAVVREAMPPSPSP